MKHKAEKRNRLRNELFEKVSVKKLDLPEALKMCRYIVGRNQKDYAELVGVSKKIISDIELNKANPTIETINKVFAPVGLKIGLVKEMAQAEGFEPPTR